MSSNSFASYAGMLCGKQGYSITDFLNNPQLCTNANCGVFITGYLNERGRPQSIDEVNDLVTKLGDTKHLNLNEYQHFDLYEGFLSRVDNNILSDYLRTGDVKVNIAREVFASLILEIPCQQAFELAFDTKNVNSREILIPMAFSSWLSHDEEGSIDYVKNSNLSEEIKDGCYSCAFMHFLSQGDENKAKSSADLLHDKKARANAEQHLKLRFKIK